jgi:hypothetical protein
LGFPVRSPAAPGLPFAKPSQKGKITMTIRDLIPWNRGRDVAVHRGENANPLLTLHREMNRVFDDVFRGFDVAPFGPRSRPLIEPLMGWTGCDDTLSQVELTFPSAAAAIAYARRQGLRYLLQGEENPDARPGSNAKATNARSSSSDVWPWRLEWVERTLGLRGDQNESGPVRGPAAYYASPQDVLVDHELSPAQKRDVLRRWALDAYLIELALFNGEPQSEPSRLDEVIEALFDLDERQASTSAHRTRATGPDCEGRAA